MKTILVTGANGYIGRHVVEELSAWDAKVVTLDVSDSHQEGVMRHIVADILSPEFRIMDYFENVPDICLHLAWRNGFQHSAPSHMLDLSGHYRFIEHLIEHGVPQVAVMGSMHEVGYWEGSVTDETPCNPQSLYGIAKDTLRRATLLRSSGTSTAVQWLRGFYLYGDDGNSQSIFGKIMHAADEGEEKFPFTSGLNKYDFLSIEELAHQITACIMQDEVLGIINCCSGKPVRLADQVEEFIRDHDLPISLEYGAYPDRAYDSPAIWGDATKIASILDACIHTRL